MKRIARRCRSLARGARAPAVGGARRRGRRARTSCSVFPANNVWHMDVSKLPVAPQERDAGSARRTRGSTLLHPDFGPPSYGIPFDVVDASHADVSSTSTTRTRAIPGPYPFGRDIHVEGGSDRHAIMVDRGHLPPLRALRRALERRQPRPPAAARLRPRVERAAARRVDERRRRRSADLPRASSATTRWRPGADRPRDPLHRRLHRTTRYVWPARHQAGRSDPACPPMGARFRLRGGLRRQRVQPRRPGRAPRDEALRHDRGRQRQRLVLPGHRRPAAGPYAFVDQLKRIPARAFVAVDESRVPGRARQRGVRVRPRLSGCRRRSEPTPGSSRRSWVPRA